MISSTDRIHKEVLLRAPVARVWQAISDSRRFGEWFRVDLEGPFVAGSVVRGKILEPGWENTPVEMAVERVEPERVLAFRWHAGPPSATQAAEEPMTLVVFELHPRADGVLLTIDESGFDALSPERRLEAYRGNEEGWAEQVQRVARYVERTDW
jgi:uncharacterized protein YndB with AHSA1/START domain